MATHDQPMICPYCGIAMNHHADKVTYASVGGPVMAAAEPTEEIIAEFHTCSQCGRSGMRQKQ